jgi:ankyrin repeat protein
MPFRHLPFDAPLSDYVRQAGELLDGWRREDEAAARIFLERHPKFLDKKIPWLQLHLTPGQIRATRIDNADAQMALARWYDFLDWERLVDHVEAVRVPGSDVFRFERAVEAVIDGDAGTLHELLKADPRLVRARSRRVTHFDPPVHRAMLLHYVAANGVEGYRQRSPKNAADVTRLLLEAGADANAVCSLYGGECTTMALLVSSTPPDRANVQVPILDVLIDHGASLTPVGEGNWTSPIETALVFNKSAAARRLVERGAPVQTVAAAAGLGRIDDVRRLLPTSSALDRRRALALASQAGQSQAVTALLDAGEDPNQFNPPGTHAHTPPLHQAVASGQLSIVKLLVNRGARLDIKDSIYHSTPLGWAIYCEKPEIETYLRSVGGDQGRMT